jgi:predicted dehydrogenase
MILAHGNSPGMEKSWKLNPQKCGNVSTDLAVHLFDIMIQLSNSPIKINYGQHWNGFWNTGIEEEAHIICSNDDNTIFNSQVSLNRWKSTFRLEINGTEGYGIVEQRGRSYGPQSYKTGKRWGWLHANNQAESEILVVDKNPCEDSFIKETISVLGINNPKYTLYSNACDHENARKIMKLLHDYESNWSNNG